MDPAMMDPAMAAAMGGGMPMDPAMMDPAMAAAMGGGIPDPAMAGVPPEAMGLPPEAVGLPPEAPVEGDEGQIPVQMSMDDLKSLIQELGSGEGGDKDAKPSDGKKLAEQLESRIDNMESMLMSIAQNMGISTPPKDGEGNQESGVPDLGASPALVPPAPESPETPPGMEGFSDQALKVASEEDTAPYKTAEERALSEKVANEATERRDQEKIAEEQKNNTTLTLLKKMNRNG
jgi:hypothetical protein